METFRSPAKCLFNLCLEYRERIFHTFQGVQYGDRGPQESRNFVMWKKNNQEIIGQICFWWYFS